MKLVHNDKTHCYKHFKKLRKFLRIFLKCEECNKRFNKKWQIVRYIANHYEHDLYYECHKCNNKKR